MGSLEGVVAPATLDKGSAVPATFRRIVDTYSVTIRPDCPASIAISFLAVKRETHMFHPPYHARSNYEYHMQLSTTRFHRVIDLTRGRLHGSTGLCCVACFIMRSRFLGGYSEEVSRMCLEFIQHLLLEAARPNIHPLFRQHSYTFSYFPTAHNPTTSDTSKYL